MTTSGTYTFSYNRDQIIRAALRKIGAIQAGEIPTSQITNDAADSLNMMTKYWESIGIHLWTEVEGVLFTQPGQRSYTLGAGSSDHITQVYPPNFVQTYLASGAGQGSTSISLNSIANVLNGDNIGISLTNSTIQWTTVNGTPSGSTVNLATGLTAAASASALVFDYTTPLPYRPLRIPFARRWAAATTFQNTIGTPMVAMARSTYRDLPNPYATGTPTQFFYDTLGGANASGVFYIWPLPTDASNYVTMTLYRPIQDFNISGDNPDLPQEWINCLVWNLAYELGPEYSCPADIYEMVKGRASETLTAMTEFDKEIESINFGVDFNMMGYGGIS